MIFYRRTKMTRGISFTESKKEMKNEDVVIVDPSAPWEYPEYAEYASLAMYPPSKDVGLCRFDPTKLERWYYGDYIKGRVSGAMVLDYLIFNDLFEDCVAFRELEGIQKKGLSFFREHFSGKAVLGIRGIIDTGEDRFVPALIEFGGVVKFCLYRVNSLWYENFVVLRFTENARIDAPVVDGHFASNVFLFKRKSS